jgi:hypothetical protein
VGAVGGHARAPSTRGEVPCQQRRAGECRGGGRGLYVHAELLEEKLVADVIEGRERQSSA